METGFLKDHEHHIPLIAEWFFREWGWFYSRASVRDIEERFRTRLHRNRLPQALVVLDQGSAVGTVSLMERDLETRPRYSPWLASLYVCAAYRTRGVGKILMDAGIQQARRLGLGQLYLYTLKSQHIPFYTVHGWSFLERTRYHNAEVYIVHRELRDVRYAP